MQNLKTWISNASHGPLSRSTRLQHSSALLAANTRAHGEISEPPESISNDPRGQALRQLRQHHQVDPVLLATQACISLRQLYQLESGENSLFYNSTLRDQAGRRVASLLGESWETLGQTPLNLGHNKTHKVVSLHPTLTTTLPAEHAAHAAQTPHAAHAAHAAHATHAVHAGHSAHATHSAYSAHEAQVTHGTPAAAESAARSVTQDVRQAAPATTDETPPIGLKREATETLTLPPPTNAQIRPQKPTTEGTEPRPSHWLRTLTVWTLATLLGAAAGWFVYTQPQLHTPLIELLNQLHWPQ